MQKLVNFQTSHFKKREQDPNIAKCEKLSINLIMILNEEIKMDGQAQVSISTKHLYSAHIQSSEWTRILSYTM